MEKRTTKTCKRNAVLITAAATTAESPNTTRFTPVRIVLSPHAFVKTKADGREDKETKRRARERVEEDQYCGPPFATKSP